MSKIGNLPLLIAFFIYALLSVFAIVKIFRNEKSSLRFIVSLLVVIGLPFIGAIAYLIYSKSSKK